jgi:uncharacterized protein YkwD
MQRKTTLLCLATLTLLVACGGGSDAPAEPGNTGTGNPPVNSIPNGSTPTSTPTPIASPPAGGGPSTDVAGTCNLPNFQADMLAAINTARSQARNCGAVPYKATTNVRWNDKLFAASKAHSADMAQRNYFDHKSPEGQEFWHRTGLQGYNTATGENIAVGYPTVAAVMQGWLNSDGHCKGIMNPSANDVAVACVSNTGGTKYWTMVLGKS